MPSDPDASATPPWTLGALRRGGYGLDGLCDAPACRGLFSFDLDQLIAGLGEAAGFPDRMDDGCPRCGGPLRLVVSPPGPPDGEAVL
jgi:hypothetical protein